MRVRLDVPQDDEVDAALDFGQDVKPPVNTKRGPQEKGACELASHVGAVNLPDPLAFGSQLYGGERVGGRFAAIRIAVKRSVMGPPS